MASYTDSASIRAVMVDRLDCPPGSLVWEPCGGHGDLADSVLKRFPDCRLVISEVDDASVGHLRRRFGSDDRVTIRAENTIEVRQPGGTVRPKAIIANPPYGAWLEPSVRSKLKVRFPNLYVRETYAVFLKVCLERLAPGGTAVFIVPDTFLWLTRHKGLRQFIFSEFQVDELFSLRSTLLPSAGFGYARLCILVVQKRDISANHVIRFWRAIDSNEELTAALSRCPSGSWSDIRQEELALDPDISFSDFVREDCTSDRGFISLGEIAEVRTGFYSGNDRRWRRRASVEVPRSKDFRDVERDRIYPLSDGAPDLLGIQDRRCFVEMMRGGASPYVKETQWYVDWSAEAVREYRRSGNNPARFQNSAFYFREGIGVPMVASRKLTAALIAGRLIDQSIVGVFPHDRERLLFLLAFLNSRLASSQMAVVNPTANNSAGYLKRLRVPIAEPDEEEEIRSLTSQIVSSKNSASETAMLCNQVDELFDSMRPCSD